MTEQISTLRDAMAAVGRARELPDDAPTLTVGLASSFTPLHLQTFLHASVQVARPESRVVMLPGLYGALTESIGHVADQGPDLCAVLIEWSDLDPRLGLRESATARRAELDDIIATAQVRLARIRQGLEAVASACPVAVVLPTLELPYVYASPAGRVGVLEARLDLLVAEYAGSLLGVNGLRIVSLETAVSERDLQSDLRSGFPFTTARAAELAHAAAEALLPRPTMKGLITDLDDTLWRGLVGEIGPDAVTWDLESGTLVHGLYQQLLAEFSRRGVLIGVCSKNEPDVVARALARPDLLVDAGSLFPIEASWNSKSAAVDRILAAWNISAQDVVFVDDSDLELAEVSAAHPGITALKFPTQEPRAVGELLTRLGALFWRERLTAEDAVRVSSLRSAAALEQDRSQAEDPVQFLRGLDGQVLIDDHDLWDSVRAFELVNKTNQFNLNGHRVAEAEWHKRRTRPGAVGWSMTYGDRFGTLGAISVLTGVLDGGTLTLDTWVLSCRAFSRGIEHHVLAALIERYEPTRIRFDFVPTDRNGVVAQLMKSLGYTEGESVGVDVSQLDLGDTAAVHAVEFVSR
ncbi:MAG: FkbH like protein [Marmoricola sp.]|nr:FkbH like protein [Marmoricola sp.]